jgi:hypothetical protein
MTDDRHPEELLAGYVDGSLSDRERTAVESHLTRCARCRDEAALGSSAVATLRTIEDEPVPVGVMSPVHAEIARRMSAPRSRPLSQRVLWAAGGAIAAAFIGLVAIWVLPNVGGSANSASAPTALTSGGGAEGANGGAPTNPMLARRAVGLEQRSTNFEDSTLQSLAKRTASTVRGRPLGIAVDTSAQPEETTAALLCVVKGAQPESEDVLVRLIEARYKGAAAFIAVYLHGPSPTQPPTEVDVWVVRTNGCAFASFTSSRV